MILNEQALKRILTSHKPTMRFLRYLLFGMVGITAIIGISASIQPLLPPIVYQKDFLQEYLISRAVLSGVNPYLPLADLAYRFMGSLPVGIAPHPSPHPPPVIFLSLPFGLLPYEQAAIIWLFFEFFCIIFCIYLLHRFFGRKPTLRNMGMIFMLLFLWAPIKDEIAVGQLMSFLLLLLIGAWLFLREGEELWGGFLLGLVIVIKLFAWPICIYLLFRKCWRAVAVIASEIILFNLATAYLIGYQQVLNYYLKTAGMVTRYYLAFDLNFSIWTLGYRLFQGTSPKLTLGINAPPLISIPVLAPAASILFAIAFFSTGLLLALRSRKFDAAFSILVCVSILINPVAWSHYLILTIIPIAFVIRYFSWEKLGIKEINASIAVLLFLFIPGGLRSLIFLFSNSDPNKISTVNISFPVSLLTLAPMLVIIALIGLLRRLDQLESQL